MCDADDVIVVPVPENVRAIYLVPLADQLDDPTTLLRAHTAGRWRGELGAILDRVLAGPTLPVEIREASGIPPLPLDLLEAMGATKAQLRRVAAASYFAIFIAQSKPGWPPAHEWITRALAAVLAERLSSDVIDIMNYQVLTVAKANATLPQEDGTTRLSDWVWVDYLPDRATYWCTTTGLRRFGLPELQAMTAPPMVVGPWGQAMTGVAQRLVTTWSEILACDRDAAFIQLPSKMEVNNDDVAAAYGHAATAESERRTASVRLCLEPGLDPEAHSFLTIYPPLSWSGSAGEHIADVCATLFGTRTSVIHRAGPSDAMDRAITTARSGMDAIRARFEADELDLGENLLVKYALHAEEGTEYIWAYVTSWRAPDRILGTSVSDAVYHPMVRAGRPVVIDASAVVDWAVRHDHLGIIEGGWTQSALDQN